MRLLRNYGVYGQDFAKVFEAVAGERRAAFAPFFLDGMAGVARLNQSGGIHPTSEGYQVIIDRLWLQLCPLLRR